MKGKIKNIANVFKPYKNPYLSLHKRLHGPDEKAEKYLDNLDKVRSYNLLQAYLHPFKTIHTAAGFTKFYGTNTDLVTFINNFTMHTDVTDENLAKFRDEIVKFHSDELESIEYEDRNSCTIKFKNGKEIFFETLSSKLDFSEDLQDLKADLLTNTRQGKCHMRSILFSYLLSNPRCYVTTAAIHDYTPRAKFLHSWVEVEKDDKTTMCLDNNWNAILSKEDYYFLQHPKIIERISKDRIVKDYEKILFLNHRISEETPYIKLYCTSPDEALEKYEELKEQEEAHATRNKDLPFYIQEL